MKKLNILFIIENYLPHIGGVEIVFKNLAERLANRGHTITILTHRLKNTKKQETINKVKVIRVNCFQSRYWFTLLAIPEAIKLAKKADIIHTTTYNGAVPAKVASVLTNTPAIITVHEILGKNWLTFKKQSPLSAHLHQFLERMIILLSFRKYIAVSNSTKKQLAHLNINKSKLKTIYNGIDYDLFNPKKYSRTRIRNRLSIKDKEFLLFAYGRTGISKGFDKLIEALPLLKKKLKNWKLVLILSRNSQYCKSYQRLVQLMKELKVEDKIILLDPIRYQELPFYHKAADCVIVPSLTEGFGFTAAESCAMDVPVVASNTTSLPEVVSGKFILVKPGDPEAIVEGICKVAKGKYIKTEKKIFSWKKAVDDYLQIYYSLKKK